MGLYNKTEKIFEKIKNFILCNELIHEGDRVLLSLSAGKDSVAMLHILSELSAELKFDLGLFHLNHLMRGAESDLDEAFINETAQSLKYKIFIERFDFTIKKKKKSFEDHARDVRYGLLNEISRNHGYNKIATAHTSDDSAETVLMRIFTGTGIHGLEGIPVRNENIIRPLLTLSSADVYGFLRNNNLIWREDLSNSDDRYLRNYVRNTVIPAIHRRFPSYLQNINALSCHAREHNILLDDSLNERFNNSVSCKDGAYLIDLEKINNNNLLKIFMVRILRERFNITLERTAYDEIIKNLQRSRANLCLYRNKIISLDKIHTGKNFLRIDHPGDNDTVTGDWEYKVMIPGSGSITCHLQEAGIKLKIDIAGNDIFKKNDKNSKIFVSFDDCDTILIRNRRKGDKIKLEYGSKKIKDLLIEKKLDNEIKNCVPLLIINNEIAAFMPGLIINQANRVSEKHKVSENSKKILVISGIDK